MGRFEKMQKIFSAGPNRYKFRNKRGHLISEQDFAETAAEYFADVQWASPEDNQLDPQKRTLSTFGGIKRHA